MVDFCHNWRGLADSREQYALRFESKYLKEVGSGMDYFFRIAVTQATQEALKYTVLSSKRHMWGFGSNAIYIYRQRFRMKFTYIL